MPAKNRNKIGIKLRSFNRPRELDTKENQASDLNPFSGSKGSKEETEGT